MKIDVNCVLRIRAPTVEVFESPLPSSGIVCKLYCQVHVRCLETKHIQLATWVRTDSGWICASTNDAEEPFAEVVADQDQAERYWADERRKQKKMASAVSSCLVRTYPLPRAKRLANSLWKHAEANYPAHYLTKVTSMSLEDVMISLGGKTGLGKQELFEFIKAAAARHSNPRQSVVDIAREVYDIFLSRPSAWVLDQRDVIITEDARVDNNRFIMSAAEGNSAEFKKFLAEGAELTSLHTDLQYTALHAAADFGQLDIIRCIISTGFSVNVREPRRGQTALHFAAYSGRPEVAQLLIDSGADRALTCLRGILPYEAAAKQGHEECSNIMKFVPPAVQHLQIIGAGINYLRVKWREPTLHKLHHAPVEEFAVTYCTEETLFDMYDQLRPSITTDLQTTITGLLPSVRYKVRVRCRSVSGWSPWSAWVCASTHASVPDAPPQVEVIKVSINSMLLRWHAPLRDNGHSIDHYELEILDEETQRSGSLESPVDSPLKRIHHTKLVRGQSEMEKHLGAQADGGNEQGGCGKMHRVLIHKNTQHLFKNITGLEPHRPYILRCRAHNRLGYSPHSVWSRSVAPQIGVTLKQVLHPTTPEESLRAVVSWFSPMLTLDHSVACYELQVCRLQGPVVVKLKSSNRENAGEDAHADVDEYSTVSANILGNEGILEGLRAGARYKCRVRPRIKTTTVSTSNKEPDYGVWVDWEDAMVSEPFSMPPTVPDAPLQLQPCRIGELPTKLRRAREPAVDEDPESDDTSQENGGDAGSLASSLHASAKSSLFTAVDSFSSHFDQRPEGVQFIFQGTTGAGRSTTAGTTEPDLGSETWDISHDKIKLCWQSGDSNGTMIEELEMYRAEVRMHNCADLLRLNKLVCDRDAYSGLEEASKDGNSDDEEDAEDEEDEEDEDDLDDSQKLRISKENIFALKEEEENALQWVRLSSNEGRFLSPLTFLATNLAPGKAYCFKLRQRNSLGWSPFSHPSPVIGTHPTTPPEKVSVLEAGQTFALLSAVVQQDLTTLSFEGQHCQLSARDGTPITDWLLASLQMVPQTPSSREPMDESLTGFEDLLETNEGSDVVANTLTAQRLMVVGLVEGQHYMVRLRRRTVVGWSAYSEPSAAFRTQR